MVLEQFAENRNSGSAGHLAQTDCGGNPLCGRIGEVLRAQFDQGDALGGLAPDRLGHVGRDQFTEWFEEFGLPAVAESADGRQAGLQVVGPDLQQPDGVGHGTTFASAGADGVEFTGRDQ